MKRIGIEPGTSFDFAKLDPAVKKALEGVPKEAQRLMTWKVATLARFANGWSMNTDTMGVYGNYFYCHRFMVGAGCCLILVAFAGAGIRPSPDASDRCETPHYAATPGRLPWRWP
jgi:hypothetical protein